ELLELLELREPRGQQVLRVRPE
ncbi:hypothetical protein PA598K_06378, partial [Paenibacillus sp. 598K]